MNVLDIPQGYKKTEVGVIPEDWLVEPLENFTSFISYGFTNPMPTTSSGPYMITAKDIDNGQIQYKGARTTDTLAFNKLLTPKSKPKKGDLLLTKDGTLGRLALVDDQLICINQSVAILRPNHKIVAQFFKLLLESPLYQERMFDDAGGSTIKHIYITIVNKMPLGLPANHKEQTLIATALSDVDNLISELEKLITKKQAIKTATMQQLLTGKTRLPQFALREDGTKKGYKQSELGEIPEDWEVKCIKDIGFVDPENLSSTTSPDYEFNYISLEQINMGILLSTTKYTFATAPSRARRVLDCDDVLISTVRPNLMSHYIVQQEVKDLVCSTGFSVVRCVKEQLCSGYLYQHLFSTVINNQIEMLISGSNYPAINSTDVRNLKIQLGSIAEQTAIATILFDMDSEIQALKKRLNKTRQIKQGMMQELLTGKTRLVQPEARGV